VSVCCDYIFITCYSCRQGKMNDYSLAIQQLLLLLLLCFVQAERKP
jgi:hypothetical protein